MANKSKSAEFNERLRARLNPQPNTLQRVRAVAKRHKKVRV